MSPRRHSDPIRRWRWLGGIGLTVLFGPLLVDWFVVSDEEAIEALLRDAAAAVEGKDLDALEPLLHPEFRSDAERLRAVTPEALLRVLGGYLRLVEELRVELNQVETTVERPQATSKVKGWVFARLTGAGQSKLLLGMGSQGLTLILQGTLAFELVEGVWTIAAVEELRIRPGAG